MPRLTIRWSQHALRRMAEDGVNLEEVREVLAGNDRIEEYPEDDPYPSALLCGFPGGRPVHVVAAYQAVARIHVVTVYRPDPSRWDAVFRRRRP